ncbi:MAG: hypothetical protein KTR16_07540 [Acidiferrobacterales bacterium]|nr:hypothetical protein [Acidiferrobacterales bacterium]
MIKNSLIVSVLLLFTLSSNAEISMSYSTVYSGKHTALNVKGNPFAPLWGANASKACSVSGIKLFVARKYVEPGSYVELYANDGFGWEVVWVSDTQSKQNPIVLCDASDKVHVLFNEYNDSTLVHYRFDSLPADLNAEEYPHSKKIETSMLKSGQRRFKFDYMAAAATPVGSKIFIAAYDSGMPPGAKTFNIYTYVNGVWYQRQNQEIYQSWDFTGDNGGGYQNTRNDGYYLYPVVAGNSHRVFAAASLYPLNNDYTYRKHWTFWDLAVNGKRRVNHYHFDAAPGQNPSNIASASNQFNVSVTAIKQVDDGTIYLLSDVRPSENQPNDDAYLRRFTNGSVMHTKVDGAVSAGSMTAINDSVIVVDRNSVHWSCDRGESWSSHSHDVRNMTTDTRLLHNLGNTHVSTDVVNGKVNAYFGLIFKDQNTSSISNQKSEIVNLEIDITNMCN